MNTITTTALIGLCTAALVLGVQRHRVSSLQEQSDDLQSRIAKLEDPTSGVPHLRSGLAKNRPSGARNGRDYASSTPSPTDIVEVHARVAAWLESKKLTTPQPREIVAILSELLELVADCNGEDLVQLVEMLGGLESKESTSGMVAMILQMLAMEADPMRFLEPAEEPQSPMEGELQGTALSALARQDPERAMAWLLENSDRIEDRLQRSAYAGVCTQALRKDVGLVVAFLSKLAPHHRETTLGVLTTTGIRQSRELIEIARKLPDEDVRRDFLQAGVASIMAHEGIEPARAALATLAQTAGYEKIIVHAAGAAVESRPAEAMAWLMGSESGSAEARAVGATIATWARRDYKAAAGWLGKQASSPNRDLAIQSFAQTIQDTDAEAATIWATEISDPDVRAPVLRANLEHWRSKDAEAAAAWEAEQ